MFRFEDPQYLYLLLLIPLLAAIRFMTYRKQKKRLRKFGDPLLLKELMPDVSRWRPGVKFWLLAGALSLLILMLARPQMGTKISHEKRTGIETIITARPALLALHVVHLKPTAATHRTEAKFL